MEWQADCCLVQVCSVRGALDVKVELRGSTSVFSPRVALRLHPFLTMSSAQQSKSPASSVPLAALTRTGDESVRRKLHSVGERGRESMIRPAKERVEACLWTRRRNSSSRTI